MCAAFYFVRSVFFHPLFAFYSVFFLSNFIVISLWVSVRTNVWARVCYARLNFNFIICMYKRKFSDWNDDDDGYKQRQWHSVIYESNDEEKMSSRALWSEIKIIVLCRIYIWFIQKSRKKKQLLHVHTNETIRKWQKRHETPVARREKYQQMNKFRLFTMNDWVDGWCLFCTSVCVCVSEKTDGCFYFGCLL